MSDPDRPHRETIFTSEDVTVVVFKGPGDNTRRPRRKNIPRDWPNRDTAQEAQPTDDQPPPGQ
jgi:hypothetical protein